MFPGPAEEPCGTKNLFHGLKRSVARKGFAFLKSLDCLIRDVLATVWMVNDVVAAMLSFTQEFFGRTSVDRTKSAMASSDRIYKCVFASMASLAGPSVVLILDGRGKAPRLLLGANCRGAALSLT